MPIDAAARNCSSRQPSRQHPYRKNQCCLPVSAQGPAEYGGRAQKEHVGHLRIKAFFGTTENAVKTQIWIAVSVYVLVPIVKKRLNCSASLYEMLQVLNLTMFERMPLNQLLPGRQRRISLNRLSSFE
jgi:ABC-type transport system involved in cytochrome c biogenesis ATPase subunit